MKAAQGPGRHSIFVFVFVNWRYYVRGTRKRPRTALSTLTSNQTARKGCEFIVRVYECSQKIHAWDK